MEVFFLSGCQENLRRVERHLADSRMCFTAGCFSSPTTTADLIFSTKIFMPVLSVLSSPMKKLKMMLRKMLNGRYEQSIVIDLFNIRVGVAFW